MKPYYNYLTGALATISAILLSFESIANVVPLPVQVGWVVALSIIVSLSIRWFLLQFKKSMVFGAGEKPVYSIRAVVVVLIFSVSAICALGVIVISALYPKATVHELAGTKVYDSNYPNPPARAANLVELYRHNNPEIMSAVAKEKSLIFVTGPAGVGKTFMKKAILGVNKGTKKIGLCSRKSSSSNECQDIEGISYSYVSELRYGEKPGQYFNKMSKIESLNEVAFSKMFEGSELVLVDDLDEVHPDSWNKLLKVISNIVSSGKVTVAVFGRPESFRPYYDVRVMQGVVEATGPLAVRPPSYLTEKEFELHAVDWAKFANFNNKSKPTEQEVKDIGGAIYQYSRGKDWFIESYKNLEVANYMCELFSNRQDWSESELKEKIRLRMFERAYSTHGRPRYSDSVYREALVSTAIDFSEKVEVNGQRLGYFSASGPPIKLNFKNQPDFEVPAVRLIALSGLAYLDPAHFTDQNWAFVPAWMHQNLVDQFSLRSRPSYIAAVIVVVIFCLLPVVFFLYGWRVRRLRIAFGA